MTKPTTEKLIKLSFMEYNMALYTFFPRWPKNSFILVPFQSILPPRTRDKYLLIGNDNIFLFYRLAFYFAFINLSIYVVEFSHDGIVLSLMVIKCWAKKGLYTLACFWS